MISSVVATAAATDGAGAALRRFAAGLRWRIVCSCGLGAALRWGMLLALPALLVAWARPASAWTAAGVAAAALAPIVLFAIGAAWWRSRGLLPALRARLRAGVATAALGDELTTWLELDGARASAPAAGARRGMLGWLERDVFDRLQPHRAQQLRAASLPRLGRWRWLAVALSLLLLAWLLSPWLQPPWSGALGGASAPTEGGAQAGGDAPAEPEGDGDLAQPGDIEPADNGEPREEQGPDLVPVAVAGEEDEGPSPPADEPPPLVDRPADQRFVLPDFIGDGPTRRERMHAAELAQSAGTGAPEAKTPRAGGDEARPPPPAREEFQRAAEKARRSRHVPDYERAIVRRFFDALQRRGGGD